MKDRLHGLIVSLYYFMLKAMKKYLNPEEVASAASQQAKDTYASGVSQAGEIYQKGKKWLVAHHSRLKIALQVDTVKLKRYMKRE